MTVGIVGRKSGMTRVFTEDGVSVPVTVVEVVPNRVTQIKEQDTDGYRAIQVTAGNRKASKVSKPEAGHFAARVALSAGTSVLRTLRTVTRFRIVRRVRSVSAKRLDACSKARRWQVTWVQSVLRRRVSRWFVLMLSATCCSSKARSPVLPAVMSSFDQRLSRGAKEAYRGIKCS